MPVSGFVGAGLDRGPMLRIPLHAQRKISAGAQAGCAITPFPFRSPDLKK
jgi:hypothetical protein